MRAVNLLAYDAGFAVSGPGLRVPKSAMPIGAALAGAALCGFVALSFTNAQAEVSTLRDDLAAVEAQQAALLAQQPKGDPQVLAGRRQHESTLASTLDYRVSWDRLLGDVGYVLPKDVLLTQLHAEAPTSPAPGDATAAAAAAGAAGLPPGFTISGIAPSQRSVAQALRRLALVPGLTDVSLQSSTTSTHEGTTRITFSAAANVRQKKEGATS
jgi:Tfp pilus assembly protein PilN